MKYFFHNLFTLTTHIVQNNIIYETFILQKDISLQN